MKIIRSLYRALLRGCALTAVVSLFLFTTMSEETGKSYMAMTDYLAILLFCLVLAATAELYGVRRLHIMIRIAVQYAVSMTAFLIIFATAGKISTAPATLFIFIFLYTVVFGVICGILFPLLKAIGYYQKHLSWTSPEEEARTPYQKRF